MINWKVGTIAEGRNAQHSFSVLLAEYIVREARRNHLVYRAGHRYVEVDG